MKMQELFEQFQNPGAAWRGKPFWSWNGELERDELIRQSHVLGEMGFGGYFMHSRSGLITEYLGDEWFDLINSTADAGEKEGLEVWLYDEDRWPSGSAGGKVSENPEYRMKSLTLFETPVEKFSWDEDIFCAFSAVLAPDGISLTEYDMLAKGDAVNNTLHSEGERKVLVFRIVPDAPNSNYNGNTYIDTMNNAAVAKFIETTHEAYKKHCGDRMGKSIKGIFTDEPHRGFVMKDVRVEDGVRICSVPWTDDIFTEFKARYGYDALPRIPELFYRTGGQRIGKTRIDYIDLTCNLFNERFMAPINEWCGKNGLVYTGHLLHENCMASQTIPNGSIMRSYLYMGYPGIDILSDKENCYWIVKQLSTVSRQFDKPWMLSELYGCTGWELPLRQHKTVGDWQALFGINLRCPHLSWYTMEGASKRDYPASISYQSAYWQDYDFVESYFARFGMLMAQGKAACDVLVMNPVESVWGLAHIGWASWVYSVDPEVHAVDAMYANTFRHLVGEHMDFDYGEEQIMDENHGFCLDANGTPTLTVGKCAYRFVVVSGMLTMRSSTCRILEEFLRFGGKVIFAGDLPTHIDGVPSDSCRELLQHDGALQVSLEELGQTIRRLEEELPGSGTVRIDGPKTVMTQVRKLENGYIVALLNDDKVDPATDVMLGLPGEYQAQLWDMESGERFCLPAAQTEDGISVKVNLEPAGSMAVVFTKETEELPQWKAPADQVTGVLRSGEYAYELDEPNVCVLDYARMRFGEDAEFGELDEVLRIDNKLRDRLGIERRGGEMLQPWFAKQMYKVPYGRLTLEYPFRIDVMPQGDVWLAGERPELQEYYCNGVRLTNEDASDWWADNAFKKMKIPAEALKLGENIITIVTDFKRTTNIEAVYLLGSFGVIAKAGASRLTELPGTLPLTDMTGRCLPFYGGRTTLSVPAAAYGPVVDQNADKILVKIPQATGTLVTVEAGGSKQTIAWEPWTADVTDAVKHGEDIRITLVNSRRNCFGPLHCVPTLRYAYDPGTFVTVDEQFSHEYARVPAAIGEVTFICQK